MHEVQCRFAGWRLREVAAQRYQLGDENRMTGVYMRAPRFFLHRALAQRSTRASIASASGVASYRSGKAALSWRGTASSQPATVAWPASASVSSSMA
jgi:hypothetical protein